MRSAFRGESAVEYFKELVEGALARQQIGAGELTAFYVVNLLAGFLQQPADADEQAARAPPRRGARSRGRPAADAPAPDWRLLALHLGILFRFAPAEAGGCGLLRAHRRHGVRATLSRYETDTFSPVFAELAENFVRFVDVLSEVSERSACASNTDLLRLYERWLRIGSPRSGQLLVERGLVPNASLQDDARPVRGVPHRATVAILGTPRPISRHLCVSARGQEHST